MPRAGSSLRHVERAVIVTVVLVSAAGTLTLGNAIEGRPAPISMAPEAMLPITGLLTASNHKLMRQEAAASPASVYIQYVPPPPPTPAPTPAPARAKAAPMPWSQPAGWVTIPVPIYRQAMVLDCETSALRMGLATFGHFYSDSGLFGYENPDTRAPVMGPNHTVVQWGDPYANFVGNVNGSDWTPTGYGIYSPPIVNIARSHGLPNTTGGEGYAPSTVYAALKAHHPVEVWVETNWMRPWVGVWTAWDGRRVRYSYVEHAVVLSGVSDTMVRVNDPLHGTQYWISKSTFETVWRDFNDMAVIFQ